MKKAGVGFFLFALCLGAADFWQSKPYTDWNEKELDKVMNNSPWARSVSVSMPGGPPGSGGADPKPVSESGGRGRGGGGGGGGDIPAPVGLSVQIVARWQSALPVKEAFVRTKFRAEAAASPEVKETLDREETNYQIVLSGPRTAFPGTSEVLKKTLGEVTLLSSKTKGAMKPADIQIATSPKEIDILFSFPRTTPYTLDDQEVEFVTKVANSPLKYKFRLKDMVFNGKLEL
jgi:hypothetical protein